MDEQVKYGDARDWRWHVYEIESHGIGYQIELETGRDDGAYRSEHVGPELDTLDQARGVIAAFVEVWGGTAWLHTLEAWQAWEEAGGDETGPEEVPLALEIDA